MKLVTMEQLDYHVRWYEAYVQEQKELDEDMQFFTRHWQCTRCGKVIEECDMGTMTVDAVYDAVMVCPKKRCRNECFKLIRQVAEE